MQQAKRTEEGAPCLQTNSLCHTPHFRLQQPPKPIHAKHPPLPSCPPVRSQAAFLHATRRAASHNKTHTTPTASFITKAVTPSQTRRILLFDQTTHNAIHSHTINKAHKAACFTFHSSRTKDLDSYLASFAATTHQAHYYTPVRPHHPESSRAKHQPTPCLLLKPNLIVSTSLPTPI